MILAACNGFIARTESQDGERAAPPSDRCHSHAYALAESNEKVAAA